MVLGNASLRNMMREFFDTNHSYHARTCSLDISGVDFWHEIRVSDGEVADGTGAPPRQTVVRVL